MTIIDLISWALRWTILILAIASTGYVFARCTPERYWQTKAVYYSMLVTCLVIFGHAIWMLSTWH